MGKIKEIFKKINNLSPAAKASFWFVVSNVMLKGISFITTPIFTRILGPNDYGITSVFVSWEGVISIFATLVLSGGVYNVAQTKYEDDIDAYTSSMIGLTFVSSLLVYTGCIVVNILAPSLFGLNNAYLFFMWIQTFTNAAITFWLMRKRFVYDYKSVIFYTMANAILSPVIAIIAILLFPNNAAYAKIIGAGVAGIAIGIYLTVYWITKGKKVFNKIYWGYALKFNLPLIPYYLSSILLNSSDKLMINSMISTASAGFYGIAHSITGLISIITQSVNYSLIPYTLQAVKAEDVKGLRRTTSSCVAIVSVVCLGVMLFAKEGILIFATKDYIDAVWFIAPLTLSVLFSFLYGIIGNIMFYYEKTWQMSAITISCAVINIALNYFGIKAFGAIAAGYTTLICSVIQVVLCYLIAGKYEKNINKIVDLKFMGLVTLIYILLMVYSMVFYDNFLMRFGLIVVVGIVLLLLRNKIIAMFKTMLAKKAGT